MKVVIHTSFGGFSITKECAERMAELGSWRAKLELESLNEITGDYRDGHWFGYGYVEGMDGGYDRTDPHLVQAVEELGEKAGKNLKVVTIPDDVEWYIHEYDGLESIHEEHRFWN